MLERMKNVLKNRKADGDKGFSLVELAVVIVIIGILVAIAIPVFAGIQSSARESQVAAAAANGSSVAASHYASGATTAPTFTSLNKDSVTVTLLSGNSLANFCVQAVGHTFTKTKGPGCAS